MFLPLKLMLFESKNALEFDKHFEHQTPRGSSLKLLTGCQSMLSGMLPGGLKLRASALILAIAFGSLCLAPTRLLASPGKLLITLPNQTFSNGSGNSGAAAGQTAGMPFNIMLTAVDARSNVISNYTGTKTVVYSGPGGAPIYTTTVAFQNGQAFGV